jgi:hypothetical protein
MRGGMRGGMSTARKSPFYGPFLRYNQNTTPRCRIRLHASKMACVEGCVEGGVEVRGGSFFLPRDAECVVGWRPVLHVPTVRPSKNLPQHQRRYT